MSKVVELPNGIKESILGDAKVCYDGTERLEFALSGDTELNTITATKI